MDDPLGSVDGAPPGCHNRSMQAKRAVPQGESAPDLGDIADVPAAVVCARCGDPECAGCAPSELTRSGIVTVVPWERPGGFLERLWGTARLSSVEAAGFFSVLPDGPLGPALRFALAAETIAATFAVAPFVAFFFLLPGVASRFLEDAGFRGWVLRGAFLAISGLTVLLVTAHAGHGAALELGARRSGVRGSWTRALRFGFYACGWDLVVGLLGVLVFGAKNGPRGAAEAVLLGRGLPTRATLAFLEASSGLTGDAAKPALRTSYVVAALVTVVSALTICAASAWALFG